jgi:hypothetical protein
VGANDSQDPAAKTEGPTRCGPIVVVEVEGVLSPLMGLTEHPATRPVMVMPTTAIKRARRWVTAPKEAALMGRRVMSTTEVVEGRF